MNLGTRKRKKIYLKTTIMLAVGPFGWFKKHKIYRYLLKWMVLTSHPILVLDYEKDNEDRAFKSSVYLK